MNLTPIAAWRQAGVVVLPAAPDGTKRPAIPWKEWTQRQPTDAEQAAMPPTDGIGVVCGAVSGNLEMLEAEGRAVEEGLLGQMAALLAAHGLKELFDRIMGGYTEYTPSGGIHWFWKVADGPALPNTKLARRRGPDGTIEVLFETRGEGGWVVTAPSGGRTHPTGKDWTLRFGGPATVAVITTAERDALFAVLREFDQMGTPQPATTHTPHSGELRPGDDYNQRATWESILEPHGWRRMWRLGNGWAWRRPGKNDGISATTGQSDDADRLYVFSSSTVFEPEKPYNKFAAYAILEHGGDHAAASRALRAAGYGGERPPDTFDALLGLLAHNSPQATQQPANPLPAQRVGQPDTGPLDPEQARQQAIRRRADEILLAEEARDLARIIRAGEPAPLTAHGLGDFLAQPDEDTEWLVDGLWPDAGRVILSAAAKSGKTTMVTNLARNLADGGKFLGQYDVRPIPAGRTLVILNLEVTDAQMRRWLRKAAIGNLERVAVANLRGNVAALGLSTAEGRARVAEWLASLNADVVVLDPLAPLLATLGLDENSNTDVATFFAWWSETLALACVRADLICHHTGHGDNGRSRGASRLMDEPDAIWSLTKGGSDGDDDDFFDTDPRFFKAWGRDVDCPEKEVGFDGSTGRLTLGNQDRRAIQAQRNERKAEVKAKADDERVFEALKQAGLRGMSRREVQGISGARKDANWQALSRLIGAGRARVDDTSGQYPRYFAAIESLTKSAPNDPDEGVYPGVPPVYPRPRGGTGVPGAVPPGPSGPGVRPYPGGSGYGEDENEAGVHPGGPCRECGKPTERPEHHTCRECFTPIDLSHAALTGQSTPDQAPRLHAIKDAILAVPTGTVASRDELAETIAAQVADVASGTIRRMLGQAHRLGWFRDTDDGCWERV